MSIFDKFKSKKQNNIEDNTVEENGGGIYLAYHCYDNTIKRNTVSKNKKGIHLAFHSSNNTITENTAVNNQYGIYLTFSSGWNRIFNNRLGPYPGIIQEAQDDLSISIAPSHTA